MIEEEKKEKGKQQAAQEESQAVTPDKIIDNGTGQQSVINSVEGRQIGQSTNSA